MFVWLRQRRMSALTRDFRCRNESGSACKLLRSHIHTESKNNSKHSGFTASFPQHYLKLTHVRRC